MAKIDNIRRIVAENFDPKDRDTVNKLGLILNSFMEQVYNSFQNQIDFSNLNQQIITVTVIVNSSGIPIKGGSINSTINSAQGMCVIKAINNTNPTTYPSAGIFCSFTQTGTGGYSLTHITGLQSNQQYTLNILLFGNNIVNN